MTRSIAASSPGRSRQIRISRNVMPGFSLTLGSSLLFARLIILLPLSGR